MWTQNRKRWVCASSKIAVKIFWAYSCWIRVTSFLWALNEMETMMVVVFNQFGLRMDYHFVRKFYWSPLLIILSSGHMAPEQPMLSSLGERDRGRKALLTSICLDIIKRAQSTQDMCFMQWRVKQRFWKVFFFFLTKDSKNKQKTRTNLLSKPPLLKSQAQKVEVNQGKTKFMNLLWEKKQMKNFPWKLWS